MAEREATVSETELAEGLHRTLSKLFSILRRGDPSAGKEAAGDLTLAQLAILFTLLDQGPIRMTDLAAHERVRTPTTTVAIRRLEKIGLVKRSRDPSDLRAVLVDITPRGLAVTAWPRWTPGPSSSGWSRSGGRRCGCATPTQTSPSASTGRGTRNSPT